jgi:hypothetical protein
LEGPRSPNPLDHLREELHEGAVFGKVILGSQPQRAGGDLLAAMGRHEDDRWWVGMMLQLLEDLHSREIWKLVVQE